MSIEIMRIIFALLDSCVCANNMIVVIQAHDCIPFFREQLMSKKAAWAQVCLAIQ